MTAHVYAGDYGFSLDFVSQLDLTTMTQVRMLIKRPYGAVLIYEFGSGEFNSVGVGDTLSYTVRQGDLVAHGQHWFQVVARDGSSLDFAFDPLVLSVEPRVTTDSWI